MASHSSTLAWKIPGMGEPGGLPSLGSHRIRHDWSSLAAAALSRNWVSVMWRPLQEDCGSCQAVWAVGSAGSAWLWGASEVRHTSTPSRVWGFCLVSLRWPDTQHGCWGAQKWEAEDRYPRPAHHKQQFSFILYLPPHPTPKMWGEHLKSCFGAEPLCAFETYTGAWISGTKG